MLIVFVGRVLGILEELMAVVELMVVADAVVILVWLDQFVTVLLAVVGLLDVVNPCYPLCPADCDGAPV